MTTNHTPGPWYLRLSDNATPHILHGDSTADLDDLAHRICVMPAEIVQSFNSFANGRLIAAAPDLLAALEGVLRIADRATIEFDAARTAIAKAKGEQQ